MGEARYPTYLQTFSLVFRPFDFLFPSLTIAHLRVKFQNIASSTILNQPNIKCPHNSPTKSYLLAFEITFKKQLWFFNMGFYYNETFLKLLILQFCFPFRRFLWLLSHNFYTVKVWNATRIILKDKKLTSWQMGMRQTVNMMENVRSSSTVGASDGSTRAGTWLTWTSHALSLWQLWGWPRRQGVSTNWSHLVATVLLWRKQWFSMRPAKTWSKFQRLGRSDWTWGLGLLL